MREAIIFHFKHKDPLVVVGEMSSKEFNLYVAQGCEIQSAIYNKNGIPIVPGNYRYKHPENKLAGVGVSN